MCYSRYAYEVCVDGRATLVMCPVSLAGQWIEQAELTWGDGLRIHQAPPRLCCLEVEVLQFLLACMSGKRSVCVQAAWLACTQTEMRKQMRPPACDCSSNCMLGLCLLQAPGQVQLTNHSPSLHPACVTTLQLYHER